MFFAGAASGLTKRKVEKILRGRSDPRMEALGTYPRYFDDSFAVEDDDELIEVGDGNRIFQNRFVEPNQTRFKIKRWARQVFLPMNESINQ